MRTDDQVDRTVSQAFQNTRLLFGRIKAVQASHFHAKIRKTRQRRIEMLRRKHGTRTHQSRLLPSQNTKVNRAESNFRFSKTDVTAKQSIHDLFRAHIHLDFRNRTGLIGGQFMGKSVFKFLHKHFVCREGIASVFRALRIQLFQVERELFKGRFYPCFCALKIRAANLAKRGICFPDVLRKYVHTFYGYVKRIPVFIGNGNVFFRPVRRFNLFRAKRFTDTVRFVHDVIPDFGRGKHVPTLAAKSAVVLDLRI